MVESKAFVLEADIIVYISEDILQNDHRLVAVREGVKRALTKGL